MPNPSTKRKPTSRSNDRKRARASRRPFSSLEPHSVCGQCIPTRLASSCRGEGQTMAYTGTLWMPQYSAPLTSHLTPGPSTGETTGSAVLTHSQTCAALCALLAGSSLRSVRAPEPKDAPHKFLAHNVGAPTCFPNRVRNSATLRAENPAHARTRRGNPPLARSHLALLLDQHLLVHPPGEL